MKRILHSMIVFAMVVTLFPKITPVKAADSVTICVKESGVVFAIGKLFPAAFCRKNDKLVTIHVNGAGGIGSTGATGLAGPSGDFGPTGATGAQGIEGSGALPVYTDLKEFKDGPVKWDQPVQPALSAEPEQTG